jgi:hypothetical protein
MIISLYKDSQLLGSFSRSASEETPDMRDRRKKIPTSCWE